MFQLRMKKLTQTGRQSICHIIIINIILFNVHVLFAPAILRISEAGISYYFEMIRRKTPRMNKNVVMQ